MTVNFMTAPLGLKICILEPWKSLPQEGGPCPPTTPPPPALLSVWFGLSLGFLASLVFFVCFPGFWFASSLPT